MRIILLIFVVLLLLSACDVSLYICNGWTYYDEGLEAKVIVKKDKFIPCKVVEYGFDYEHIIAKQFATEMCYIGEGNFDYRQGFGAFYYWIIVLDNDSIIGPLNYHEYQRKRINVGVDEGLSFSYYEY